MPQADPSSSENFYFLKSLDSPKLCCKVTPMSVYKDTRKAVDLHKIGDTLTIDMDEYPALNEAYIRSLVAKWVTETDCPYHFSFSKYKDVFIRITRTA